MSEVYLLGDIACECRQLAYSHRETWRDRAETYWLAGLVEEVGELASALNGRHEHDPEYELRQIAAIAMNWLHMRAIREADSE